MEGKVAVDQGVYWELTLIYRLVLRLGFICLSNACRTELEVCHTRYYVDCMKGYESLDLLFATRYMAIASWKRGALVKARAPV
jgi:hypothetical protein